MDRKIMSILREMSMIIEEAEEAPKESGVDTPDSAISLREPKQKARPASDSVDDQIDALILRYESASIREEKAVEINESLRKLNLKFLLEQDGEAPPEDDPAPPEDPVEDSAPPDDTAGESEEQSPAGSEDMSVTEPADRQNTPDLDVDKFTIRTVRLVNNYKNLLNIEEAIINRAKNFLDENYGEVFVNEFLETLSAKYGLDMNEFTDIPEVSDDNFAVGAFAGGTGGLGGGGGGA